ncbi:MAG: NAD(P)/FAD-dependent oxidoreductase [Clostridia bacterium]|nr:NAD(P)/FAD-dependent oxidoreductase [Clostridia bacterium]
MENSKKKTAVIIGAGPAGLTAAYLLLKETDIKPVILEESEYIGGIARTHRYNGNRMDLGGHRFFTKSEEINRLWDELMPLQGKPSFDDLKLGNEKKLNPDGPDPETEDRVMLSRRRLSRIFFDGKFYDYPISLKAETFKNFGFATTMKVGFSYLGSVFHKRPETNLENLYINSFGKKLYGMFFEYYTENLWGRHPSEIDASWGKQRTKGLSIFGILKDAFGKIFKVKNRKVNTSLIEEFKYPKLGPGQLWEFLADDIRSMGGEIVMNCRASGIRTEGKRVTAVVSDDGRVFEGDEFFSTMPVRDLVAGIDGDVPEDVRRIAAGLPYRDYQTVGMLVDRLALENRTDRKTLTGDVPDCWIYIQDRNVKLGRLQIYNNWSPYLVRDPEHTVWIGLEYFCSEGDEYWNMSDEEFISMAKEELAKIGVIHDPSEVRDACRLKVKKAYPAYFDTYSEFDTLKNWLSGIENLWCLGRNGQHRYNNMDHSMMTAVEAVRAVKAGSTDKTAVWGVNTEEEYHEAKQGDTEIAETKK